MKTLTSSQRTALRGFFGALFICGVVLWLMFITAACSPISSARHIVEAQTPGQVTGAGATLVGPANSATGSSQIAERRMWYRPTRPAAGSVPVAPPVITPAPRVEQPPIQPAAPEWIYERTETTLGQHQDAAGIVKVAATMSAWSSVKWIGLLCILVCLGGLLWSHGNPDGYPLVFWKVGGIGLFLVLVGDNPFWLLLLLLPLGFYAIQRLNLLRLP